MKLFIDHRERGVARIIEGLCGEMEFVQLPLGDYLVPSGDGSVLVERKTVVDFLSSVRSNRLWDQLLRLMKAKEVLGSAIKRRILLIHGDFGNYLEMMGYGGAFSERDLLVFWSQMMGAFLEILYVYDTPIILAQSDVALRAFFKTLIRREAKGLNDKLPKARWYRKRARADLPIRDRKRYILSSIPSIGELLAKNLLEHFDTISDIVAASIEELQNVPKIGRKKAEIIYEVFHS